MKAKKLINKLATLPASIYRRVPARRGRRGLVPHQTLGQRLAEGTAASPPTGFFPHPYEAVRRLAGPILKAGPRPVPAGPVGAILRHTRVGVWCGGAA